jgi:hypothetical protein
MKDILSDVPGAGRTASGSTAVTESRAVVRLLTTALKTEAAQGAFDLRYSWSDSVEVLT